MTTLMQGLIQLSGHPLVYALGWTLLHFCWQGAAVALMLGCVLGLLGGRSSQARYGAACLALGLMVALPAATFAHVASSEYKARAVSLGSGVVLDAGITLEVGAAEPVPPWPMRIAMVLDHSLPWVLLTWFAGVVVFAWRLNFGLLVARRLKTAGTEFPSPALLQLFEDLRIRLGVERAVKLLHSAQVQVPTVIGWLRPVVLLPVSCLTGLSPEQIEAVLCHELAHVRRHDYLVSVAQSVIETVLFYHPAVWWVSRQVRRERECCCDELAVEVGGDVLAYARALSFLEENRASFPEFVLGANGGVLKMRIKRILGSKRDAEGSPVAALVALGLILAVAGSYFAAVSHAQAQARTQAHSQPQSSPSELAGPTVPAGIVSVSQDGTASPAGPTAQPLQRVYKVWLEQDVRWIITGPEAQAFKQLANDTERDKFIEQFWARRDPPGASAGTYREEHYARIAYSNEHFASNDHVGWMSDRGHIYIVYGKPSGIDSHPSGGSLSAYPYEVWHYKYIAGIGDSVDLVFVDTCKCGDYHYTIDPMEKTVDRSYTGPGLVKQESAELDAVDAQISLAKKLLAPPAIGDGEQNAAQQPTAPQQTGSISGKILDSHGAPVPGAKVTATNTDDGVKTVTQTDNKGGYSFAALPPGPYIVDIQAKGFQRTLQENVQVKAGQTVSLNLKLSAGAGAETPSLGAAQGTGFISGTIVDPHGALVPRANVTAINIYTGFKTVTQSDNSGTYSTPPLAPGTYDIEAAAPGFAGLREMNIKVDSGRTVGLNLKMIVGIATQNLTVNGEPQTAPPPSPQWAPPWKPAPPKPSGPQRVSSGVMQGLIISQPQPVYPDEAKAEHVQGAVVLHARISKEGAVKDVQAISGPPLLIVSAVDAVRQWKYKPYLVDGEPTEVDTIINVHFTLAGDAGPSAPPEPPSGAQADLHPATPPMLIYKVDPEFSAEARQQKIGGVVLVSALVNPQGVAENIQVVRGIGHGLDEKAVEAVKQYRFKPATENGKPVSREINIEVNFKIMDSPEPKVATTAPNVAAVTAPQEYNGLPVRKVGGGVTAPVLIQSSSPEYTKEAKKAKFKGIVLVNLIVDANGMPQNVHVSRGVGMGLDEKAVDAVKQYRFKPAMEGDKPVPVELNVEVNFQIF